MTLLLLVSRPIRQLEHTLGLRQQVSRVFALFALALAGNQGQKMTIHNKAAEAVLVGRTTSQLCLATRTQLSLELRNTLLGQQVTAIS